MLTTINSNNRGGAVVRTARAFGKWISRAVNSLGEPYANDGTKWSDWPRFPPF